jgi:hypothetical protein
MLYSPNKYITIAVSSSKKDTNKLNKLNIINLNAKVESLANYQSNPIRLTCLPT